MERDASRVQARREVVLRTPRLTLTSWLADDVEALHEVHSDPETMVFVRHGRPEPRAIVAVGNDASARVLEKVGFDEVGEEDFDGTLCRAFVHPHTDQLSPGGGRIARVRMTDWFADN